MDMGKRKDQINSILKAKDTTEMLSHISWNMLSGLAVLPLLLFAISPVYQFIHDSFSVANIMNMRPYAFTLTIVFSILAVVSGLAILAAIGKYKFDGGAFRTGIRENMALVWFGLFILCMIISTCVNGFTAAALEGDYYRDESLFTYILYITGFFVCGMLLRSKKHKRALLYTILGSSCVIAITAMIHVWVHSLSAYLVSEGLSAVFHQFNHYGYFLLVSILISAGLFVTEKKIGCKIFCMIAFLLNNIVLIVNDTFGCYLAAFVGLIFLNIFFICRDRRLSRQSLLLVGIFVLISIVMSAWYDTIFTNIFQFSNDVSNVVENSESADSAGSGRWTLWTHTVKYISEKPLFGFGIEGIYERLMEETNGVNSRPHNEYLQYAVFFGIPAALFYVCGILSVFLRAWRQRHTMDLFRIAALVAAFGYCVDAVFGNTMYYTAPYLFLLLGMAYSRDPE